MADYQIGPHAFQLIEGAVPARSAMVEVIEKKYEDGHIRRIIGDRSPQFRVVAKQHYPSFVNARNGFETYTDLTVEGIQTFCKDGINYSSLLEPYGVVVVNVEMQDLRKHHCISATTNTIWLETVWTLIFVPSI